MRVPLPWCMQPCMLCIERNRRSMQSARLGASPRTTRFGNYGKRRLNSPRSEIVSTGTVSSGRQIPPPGVAAHSRKLIFAEVTRSQPGPSARADDGGRSAAGDLHEQSLRRWVELHRWRRRQRTALHRQGSRCGVGARLLRRQILQQRIGKVDVA